MARTSESEIGIAVLRILAGLPNGEATVDDIAKKLPGQLALSFAKNEHGSPTTNPDENWGQRVNNLRLQEAMAGNVFHDNYLIRATRGEWRITPLGQKHVAALS